MKTHIFLILAVFSKSFYAYNSKRSATLKSSLANRSYYHVSCCVIVKKIENLELSLKFFRHRVPKFSIGVFLKVHSTSAANRSRVVEFVPLSRERFNRHTVIISQMRYFPYLYPVQLAFKYCQINIHCMSLSWRRTARSTSSECTLLLVCCLAAKIHFCRANEVLQSVHLSVPCLLFTHNRDTVEISNYGTLNARHELNWAVWELT